MLSIVEKALFLKSIDLFASIPGEDLAQVAQFAREEKVEAGLELFAKGEPGDALYLVVDGAVQLDRGEGSQAKLGPKQSFGEMAILDGRARAETARTAATSRLLKIVREDFQELLASQPEIAKGVIRALARRL